jgi:hypothetical protein
MEKTMIRMIAVAVVAAVSLGPPSDWGSATPNTLRASHMTIHDATPIWDEAGRRIDWQ